MRRHRPAWSVTVAPAALVMALGGCGGAEPQGSIEKVKAAFAQLGARPETVYHQSILDTDPESGEVRTRKIALVPTGDGKGFRIVDSEGEIYTDYYDFVRNNRLPRAQPLSGTATTGPG